MTNEAYLQRKWFGGRDTEHLTFTEAVELTMQKKYEWKGLTDDEINAIPDDGYMAFYRAIEAKLKELNS